MSSAKALRACTQVLVLINLVFVQMTEAAGLHALIPLYALTLAAPLLQRFAGNRAYLTAWNLLVMGIFGVLIWSVTRGDLGNVLEYGLILAVLCQVHLLNNLRLDQRPDLLFFNAFLIAVVAGYINRGSTFGLLFLAFVPPFLMGLELLAATGDGQEPGPRATGKLLRDGAKRSGVLLSLSLLVFVFWPRDFERKAFFHGRLDFTSQDDASASVGFTDMLSHRRRKSVGKDNRPALRIQVLDGDQAQVTSLWRGALLGITDGTSWEPLHPRVLRRSADVETDWVPIDTGHARRGAPPESVVQVSVQRLDPATQYAFVPASTYAVKPAEAGDLELQPSGGFQSRGEGSLSYELLLDADPAPEPGGTYEGRIPRALRPYIELPSSPNLDAAHALAAELVPDPEGTDQFRLVQRIANHLRENYSYLPPGSSDAPDSLAEFLGSEEGGHCELFASGFATMLRSLSIPCRIATGYRGDHWDPASGTLTLRMSDAHAWVEVYDPTAGWMSVDPTPAAFLAESKPGLFARAGAAVRSAWNAVTGFDEEARAQLFAWARTLPARGLAGVRSHPLATTGVLALIGSLLVLRRRRRTQDPLPVREYRAAIARAKITPLPGETPREILERATSNELEPVSLARLRSATEAHERERYAGRS